MAIPLDPLTPCTSEEETCTLPATVNAGDGLLVVDPLTKCNRLLNHVEGSIPVSDGLEVRHHTGAVADEICLPALRAMSGASFPRLLAQDNAGKLGQIAAPDSCVPHILVGKDGNYSFEVFESPVCYDQADICECVPTELTGWIEREDCEGNMRLCLVRFPLDEFGIDIPTLFFASTSCIAKTGVGTEGDPYKFSIKISADANNCIECRDDGLFVECGIYGGADPIDGL